MMIRLFILFLSLLFSLVHSYEQNPDVSPEVWELLSPYFLPEDHPIKRKLDILFSTRVTLNAQSLEAAGFENSKPQKYSRTIIAKHKNIKGYYFKLFTDEQAGIIDWEKLYPRVLGAERVKNCLDRNQLHHLCKVPKKWIYPLPANPSPPESSCRKNFILIAEDMSLYSRNISIILWKTRRLVTYELLDAVYLVLQEEGMNDSVYVYNMPFSKVDGKVAFVDLEETHVWPVHFERLTPYLSDEMRDYWTALYESHQ